eukprot:jgi/Botrbrau1/22002/Bobra.0024s0018.1
MPQSGIPPGSSSEVRPLRRVRTRHIALFCSLLQTVRGCTRWEMGGAGFASGINNLYLAYPAFSGFNGTFYIDSRSWAYACSTRQGSLNNGMFDFFELEGIAPWTEVEDKELRDTCRISGVDAYREAFFKDMPTDYHDLQVSSAIRLWRLKPWLQSVVDRAVHKMRRSASPTVGFHVRGGDKPVEDVAIKRQTTKTKDLLRTFKEQFPNVTAGTCVIVGDTPKLNQELAGMVEKELGCHVYYPRAAAELAAGGHVQADFQDASLQERCARSIRLFEDIVVLANTDYFVGSFNSGIPCLIDILRFAVYGKSRRTFADASVDRRDWFSHIRTYLRERRASGVDGGLLKLDSV